MLKKRIYLTSAIVLGALITLMLVTAAVWPVINVVETGQTPEYPELQPLYYSADPGRVFDEAVASVKGLERFTLVSDDAATRTIEATATMPVLGLTQDVTVKVEPVTDFVTRVHTISRSRVGKGDLGQNARNVEALHEELGRRLGAVRFDPVVESNAPDGEAPAPSIPATE